jgi:hypothetical protein
MEILGGVMMAGMMFGAVFGAANSGKVEDKLRQKIGQVKDETVTMNNQMQMLASDVGKLNADALDASTTAVEKIVEITTNSKDEIASYLYNEKMTSIYGIVFVLCVVLYLLAKLLLPSYKDIINL